MELKSTRYEVADRLATIELHRPDRRNAWTGRMHHELRWLLAEAENDPAVGAIIITGAGPSFCVGADTTALEGHADKGGYDPGTPDELPLPGERLDPAFSEHFTYLLTIGKPVAAALPGPAAGVGLVLACYCDLRYAVPGAKLTTAHGRWNMPAEYGLSWLLPRLIGASRATELLMTSRVFTTDEAADYGLIHRLVDPDSLLDELRSTLTTMLDTVSPGSLRSTKHQLALDHMRDVGASVRDADARLAAMVADDDYAEAVRAWTERRMPNWSGGRP